MKSRIAALLVASLTLATLSGCATLQPQLALTPDALNTPSSKIGVIMDDLPKTNTWFPGANCLLCLAVASAANSKLTDYTRTLPQENLPKIKEQVADVLRKKGASVTVIDEKGSSLPKNKKKGPNIALRDHTSLKAKHNVDKMIVISLSSIGISRPYASYFPTGAPQATVIGLAYLINLDNNTYEWYMPIQITQTADGQWDEPPSFPGLTNAYYQVLELTTDAIIKPLSN